MTRVLALLLALTWSLTSDHRGLAHASPEVASDEAARAIVMTRVGAAWCGTCAAHTALTEGVLEPGWRARVTLVDVSLANEDNVASDPTSVAGHLAHLPAGPRPLPWIILTDADSGKVLDVLTNPSVAALRATVARTLGEEPSPNAALTDGRFDQIDMRLLRAMRLPAAPPPDSTNAVADSPAAAAFGRKLFFDGKLSPRAVHCASCHDPSLIFTDGKGVPPAGAGQGVRNVPSIVLAGHARWQLWDGRADTLWSQALIPFEDANELASSRLFVAHAVAAYHRDEYTRLFGPLPDMTAPDRFPKAGKPGDADWEVMRSEDQRAVTAMFVNVGKSIAAFERSIQVAPNALDRYLDGDSTALDAAQKDGLLAFFRAGCAQCHHGPRLTDDAFHVLRFPTGHKDGSPDQGRVDGITAFANGEFRTRSLSTPDAAAQQLGAFKTPGLRGVAFTLPYGHGGAYGGLKSVIDAHRTCGLAAESPYTVGSCEPWVGGFESASIAKIQVFLRSLRADPTYE